MVRPSPSRLRSRLLLSGGGFVAALLLVEAVLRAMPPLGPEFVLAATIGELENRAFRDDPALRVVLAPSVSTPDFTTNELGIRGASLPQKRAGERRILAIGDSFTLGMQVPDDRTFPALLDEALGESVRVMNAGVPGYGTDQATGLMRRLVPQTNADAVLLTVYSGNDLRDNARWEKQPGLPTTPPPVRAPPPQRSRFIKRLGSASRVVAYALLYSDLSRMDEDFRIEEFRDEVAPFALPGALGPLLPPTQSALRRFHDACRQLAVRCGVALVPPAYVVHTARRDATFEAFGLQYSPDQIDQPARALLNAVPSAIPSIDLTPALQAAEDQRPYLLFDPHFSAAGHRIAAEELAPFLTNLLEGA
ncbi:MAG: GDSL-type esterase/lipase family protein [Myxococcota bacterium]|nr:GDSL-type esterase/lipase family protein [Myxococcota bacterium]